MPRGGPALFPFAYAYAPQEQPGWARGCVGYQIFPDRFRRAGGSEEGVEPWTSRNYQNECRFGGNLAGIREAVPYLKELGVGLVYMTPIFLSDTSHRYNTFDYFTIDPLLGTREELRALTDELHAAGNTIVLITHDPAIASQAPRSIHIHDGRVLEPAHEGEVVI